MQEVLVLFSSPHENGATRKLLNAFLGGLEKVNITEFDVCKTPVRPCTACGLCKKISGCSMPDFDAIDAALRESDLLVVASPVYNITFPAQLKSVIDRFQRYFEARFARGEKPAIQKPRNAVLLLTMGRHDPFSVEVCEKILRQSFSVMHTKLLDTICLTDTDSGAAQQDSVFAKARALAIEIDTEMCYNLQDISL